MAENYVVNYSINVKADQATTAITNFQQAVAQLKNINQTFNSVEKNVNKLVTSLGMLSSKKYSLQIGGIAQTKKDLDSVITKLERIDKLASRNLGRIRNMGGSTQTGTSKGSSGAARTGTSKGSSRTQIAGGRRYTASPSTKSGIPLVRNTENIGYKTLGPTPLPSNGGIAVDMLQGMGIAYGISGIGQAISSIVEQSTGYDNTMKTVENILKSHDTSEDFSGRFQAMSRLVRNVGMETKFTVTQVADAAKFLAMAGLDVDAIQKSIRPIADIALVGDTDLGETADLVTNVMTAYNIAPSKMRQAADVMTNTFTMSNTTLNEIAESYKYAASILSAGGVGFEEATGAIGVLGDAGIKGSQAGTTMRTIMANIVNPTKKQAKAWKAVGVSTKDKNGETKSLLEIFQELNKKNLNVADYYKLFHKTAASGAIALADHVDKWNNIYLENLTSGGISSKLADEKKNTLQGKWAQLTSTFTDTGVTAFQGIQGNLQIWMDQAINWLKSDEAAQVFKDVANTMIEFIHTLIKATEWFKKLFDVFAPIIKLWIKLQLVIWPVVKGIQAFKSVWLGLKGFGAIGANIAGVTRGMQGLAVASQEAAAAGTSVGTAVNGAMSVGTYNRGKILRSRAFVPKYRKNQLQRAFLRNDSRLTRLVGEWNEWSSYQGLNFNNKKWRRNQKFYDRLSNHFLNKRDSLSYSQSNLGNQKYLWGKDLWAYAKYKAGDIAEKMAGPNSYLLPMRTTSGMQRWTDRRTKWARFAQNARRKAQDYDALAARPDISFGEYRRAINSRDAYNHAADKAEAVSKKLTGKKGYWNSVIGDQKRSMGASWTQFRRGLSANALAATGNIVGMGAGAAGSYMMMQQATKEKANGWDYGSAGLYGIAGMAAMSGGPAGWAIAAGAGFLGYVTQVVGELSRAQQISQELQQFATSHRLIDGVLVDSDSKTMQYMEFVWRKEYDINELVERRAQLYKEMYGLDIPEKTTNKDVGTSIFAENMKRFDEENHWYRPGVVGDDAAKLFNSYGAQYGLTVGQDPDSGRYGVKLPNGQFIDYAGSHPGQTAAVDVAAATEMLTGGYYTKIVEEYQKKIAQGLYSKGTTAEGMAKIANSLASNYNPANMQGLIKPNGYDISLSDAMTWTGDDVSKSYLGNMLVWLALEKVRESQRAVQNFKEKLASGKLVESDVVNALKYGDNSGLGLHLANYDPNNIGGWFESFGYQNGKWVTGNNGETPEFQAQGAAASMQQLLDSIKRLGLEASPATEQLRAYAETLLTLAQSYMNAGQGITGSKDGETRTVNGQTWRWNAANKVWELDDKDNSLGEMAQGLMAFSESIQAVKTSLGMPMSTSIFDTPWSQYGTTGNSGAGAQGGGALGLFNTPWSQYGTTGNSGAGKGGQKAGAKNKPKVTVATLPTAATTANRQPGIGSGGDPNKKRNGPKASDYKNHYNKNSAAPKQVIVRIGNLMNVDKIDLSNPNNAAVIANLKSELAQALVDVVHDFDQTWNG